MPLKFFLYFFLYFDLLFYRLLLILTPFCVRQEPVKNVNLSLNINCCFPISLARFILTGSSLLHLSLHRFLLLGKNTCSTIKMHVFVFLSHASSECCVNVVFLPSYNIMDSFWSKYSTRDPHIRAFLWANEMYCLLPMFFFDVFWCFFVICTE